MGDKMATTAGSDSEDKVTNKPVSDDTADCVRNLDELRLVCQELAEQVRLETLSRWSMQQALRIQFPQHPEADVTHEMQEALRRALGEEWVP